MKQMQGSKRGLINSYKLGNEKCGESGSETDYSLFN